MRIAHFLLSLQAAVIVVSFIMGYSCAENAIEPLGSAPAAHEREVRALNEKIKYLQDRCVKY